MIGRKRSRLLLTTIMVLAAGCSSGGHDAVGGAGSTRIVRLRTAAALPACPAGIGRGLPRLTLACLSGGPKVVLRGQPAATPMLVNIWATWCGPCVREVPRLIAFEKAARGRVGLLGVLTEDEPAQALLFARQFHMPYTSVEDPDGTVLRAFSPGPPATLFVNPAGDVVFVKRGEIKSVAELEGLVRAHLGVLVAGSAPSS
jgi:cytochrome c biogenesis protein CcmG/thiol:disulfide interchange protein DsbE